jgi:hypothetical protein
MRGQPIIRAQHTSRRMCCVHGEKRSDLYYREITTAIVAGEFLNASRRMCCVHGEKRSDLY